MSAAGSPTFGCCRSTDRPRPTTCSTVADRDQLERGFRRLPPDQRAILVLHHFLGYAPSEIAETLGIPPGTARSRLHTPIAPCGPPSRRTPACPSSEVARHDRERDIERLLDRWFADGPTEVADRVIDEVADRIDRQPQRPAWRVLLEGLPRERLSQAGGSRSRRSSSWRSPASPCLSGRRGPSIGRHGVAVAVAITVASTECFDRRSRVVAERHGWAVR